MTTPRRIRAVRLDDLVMLSLTDPDRATRISMDTSEFYIRQLLIRAAAVGERIAIYSHQPHSVGRVDTAEYRCGRTPPATGVRAHHHRQRPAHCHSAAGLSSTVITLGPNQADAAPPDIRFEQTSDTTVQITRRARPKPLDVAMVIFLQEQSWTGRSTSSARYRTCLCFGW